MYTTQNTLDSYCGKDTTESKEHRRARGMIESREWVTYDDLIEKALDGNNITKAST